MNNNYLCTICARRNSKGVLRKNYRTFVNTSLMEISIKQALRLFKNVIVSTDINLKSILNEEIISKLTYFKRSKKLSGDNVNKLDVIRDAMEIFTKSNFKPLHVIDLDVTTPLRTDNDIKKALKQYEDNKSQNLISVNLAKKILSSIYLN